MNKERKLKVVYDESNKEINVYGNRDGLLFLAEVCKQIISDDCEHHHFAQWSDECKFTSNLQGFIVWHVDDIDDPRNLNSKKKV